jgi:hypothetical protein
MAPITISTQSSTTLRRNFVRPDRRRLRAYHGHKRRRLIRRQNQLPVLGRSDPVRQMLRSQIMPAGDVRYHGARRYGLGDNPPLLLTTPSPAANHARYFGATPNDLRVVTNVDHNVHTIRDSQAK